MEKGGGKGKKVKRRSIKRFGLELDLGGRERDGETWKNKYGNIYKARVKEREQVLKGLGLLVKKGFTEWKYQRFSSLSVSSG